MKRFLLLLTVCILFSGLFKSSYAQCPPTVTLTPRGSNVTINGHDVNLCPGEAVQIDASPGSGVTYQWFKDNILVPDSGLVHFWAKEIGSYTVIVSGSGCPLPSVPVNVTYKVQPEFTITSNPSPPHICAQQSIALTVYPSPWNANWVWIQPPSVFGTNTNPLIPPVLSSTTTFVVVGTHPTSFCTNSSSITVTVDDIIDGGSIQSDQTICAGTAPNPLTSVTLPTGGGGPGTYTYAWGYSNTGILGSFIQIGGANQIDYAPGVLYQTTWFLRWATSAPCSAGNSDIVMITVNEAPQVTSDNYKFLCSGSNVNYHPTSNIAGTTFTWTAVVQPGPDVNGVSLSGTGDITDFLSLDAGVTSAGSVKYTIIPHGPGTTQCQGIPLDLLVTVNPIPSATIADPPQTICSGGSTTLVNLQSGVWFVTYDWYTTQPAGITPVVTGTTAFLPAQQFISTRIDPAYVTYHIRVTGPGPTNCPGEEITYAVLVNPSPTVTNDPMSQAICSEGTSTEVILESNVAGTEFNWTATANPLSLIFSPSSGTSTIPVTTITNPTSTLGIVTYHITPSGNLGACPATPKDYLINVYPKPTISSPLAGNVCSNSPYIYTITSAVAGSTFHWSRAPVFGISNGFHQEDGFTINETLINLTTSPIDVTYVLTPTGPAPMICPGVQSNLVVTVKPQPIVSAGSDKTINCGTSTILNGSATGGTGSITNISWIPISQINGPANILTPTTKNLNSSQIFTITVTDAGNCSNTDAVQVNVTGNCLTVLPTATPQVICVGEVSHLNANASGGSGIYTYVWSPGSSTSVTLDVTPIVTTTYSVLVNDGYSSLSGSVTVTVNPLPVPYQVTGGGEYCSGGIGVLIGLANSQLNVHYQLFRGPAPEGLEKTGTGADISFGYFTTSGTYTVSAHNATTGCTGNMTGSVTVTINPLPAANAGPDQSIAYGISTVLSGIASSGTPPFTYEWSPGSSIVSGQTGLLNPATTNLYVNTQFIFTVTDHKGCIGSNDMWVYLNGDPLSIIPTAIPNVICNNGTTIQLNVVASGGSGTYNYSWTSNPPGFSSPLPNPIANPNDNIEYLISVNDLYNTVSGTVPVIVNPLPNIYNITGGGSYCAGGSGVAIGLDNSQTGVSYQLFRGISPYGMPITGTGSAITFGNHTVEFSYTVEATNLITGCKNIMNGSVNVVILPLPILYTITGGGAYPEGGTGVPIGLSNSQIGVTYRLVHIPDPPPALGVDGTGFPITFGNQTQEGTYVVEATNTTTHCETEMSGSVTVTINPLPLLFNVTGGGQRCVGQPGIGIGLDGSEVGIRYVLLLDGDSIAYLLGTGNILSFGQFQTSGIYTVKGINILTGFYRMMSGSSTIIVNSLPIAFLMVPQGDTCSGTELLLNGSEWGINYYLLRGDDTITMQAGTGLFGLLSFGNQFDTGTYHVVGINPVTGCKMDQLGTVRLLPAPLVFDIIPPGILCPGEVITLSGSQLGINYQLRRDSLINVGIELAGTGIGLSFGSQYIPGVYRVVATNPLTHCYSWQNRNSTIQPGPDIYSIVPNGDTCAGGMVRLNGSQTGIYYHLILNGTVYLDSLYGTGSPLIFGFPTTGGVYKILAVDTLTHCEAWMDGQVNVFSTPISYNIIPNGLSCEGSTIGLDNSETGVDYTLLRDNWIIAGGPLSGTGFPLSFGIQSLPGSYTIEAKKAATGCSAIMSGISTLYPRPLSFILMPEGEHCAGTDIYLNGSQTGVNYSLLRDGMVQQIMSGSGAIIDFGFQYIAGIYTIKAVNAQSTCDTLMSGSATIIAAPLAFNITPAGANCSPAIIGLTGSQTGVSYQLIRNGAAIGSPVSGTGNALSFGPQADGYYRITATSLVTTCSDTMTGSVIITPGPLVFAGNDTTICASHPLALQANGYSYTTIQWFTSGDGIFSNTNISNPIYTPGSVDISGGGVYLSAWVHGLPACPSAIAKDTLFLSIHPYPVASAGNNDTICAVQTYSLNGTAQDYSAVLWRTTGDGHFDNSHVLNPVYSPGIADKSMGQVQLTLTVHGSQQCLSDTISDGMVLYIEPLPLANAGSNDTICETISYRLAGIAEHSSAVLWSTTGDGIFDNATILAPYYSPGINDKNSGNVRLILTAFGILHCDSELYRDTMMLYINKLPVVFAGNDDTICANQSFSLYATAQRHSSVEWTSNGDGVFNNSHSLTAIYYPGSSDKNSGQVQLNLTAWGILKCISETVGDSLLLRILPMPVANAGTDTISCPNVAIPLSGSATNYMSVLWATLGDGLFDNTSLLHPHYTPGATDNSAGHVLLTMTVNGEFQCGAQISTDTVRIDFHPLPGVTISGTSSICEGNSANLVFNLTGTPPWSITYFDGLNTHTVQNIPASPYTVIVSPVLTTTYTLNVVQDANCYGIAGNTPSFTIYVHPKPLTFQMTSTNGGGYCEGGTGVGIGIESSQIGIFYQLLFGGQPDGVLMPGTGNAVSFGLRTAPGIYKVLATHPQTTCQTLFPDSIRVVVFATPNVNFTADSSCVGIATQFHISGIDISKIALWTWHFGDGATYSHTAPVAPSHLYPMAGTFTAILDVIDTNGCTKTITHQVSVGPLPTALFSSSAPSCQGDVVFFSDHSYTPGVSYLTTWHWDFGDGHDTTIVWSGNPNVGHRYLTFGTFTVRLTVSNNHGCSSEISRIIAIDPAPVANFDYSNACAQELVSFTDISQENGGSSLVEWHWNFGDPTSGTSNVSNLRNPVHEYHLPGMYQVILIVMTANGCDSSIIKTVEVQQQPQAIFISSAGCVGNLTQFTDQSIAHASSILSWDWNFGDGFAHSNLQNPSHLYALAGDYDVTLTIMNSNFCSHDTTLKASVIPLPIAAFNSNAPQCFGAAVSFQNLSSTTFGQIVQWEWDFGDGTTTTIIYPGIPNVSHTFAGTLLAHLVKLRVTTSSGCVSFTEHMIYSTPGPVANFSYPAIHCEAQNIPFTDNSQLNGGGAIQAWFWDFGDPTSGTYNVSNLQNPSHSFTSEGSFDVRLIVMNDGNCRDTIIKSIVIGNAPIADFTADTACLGTSTQFTDESVSNPGTIVSWDWNFGDGAAHAHIQNPVHLYTVSGNHLVTLVVTNASGCSHSINKQVQVIPSPVAGFSNSISNCAGSEVSFNDLSYPIVGYLVKWIWNFGDGNSETILFPNPQNVSHIYNNAGNYNVSLSVQTNDSCSASIAHLVTVGDTPLANFDYGYNRCEGSAVQFEDLSQPSGGVQIISWNWNFGDPASGVNNTSSLKNPVHVYQNPGTYPVRLIVQNVNNCSDTIIKTLDVNSTPTVAFTADTVCNGAITHFTDNSIANSGTLISWAWDFGDGTISSEQNPTHTYADAGLYEVTLSVVNSLNCQGDTLQHVLVYVTPHAQFSYSGHCIETSIAFEDESWTDGGSIYQWHWEFGDGDTSNLQNPTHIYASAGTYNATLMVRNTLGCTDNFAVPVIIYQRPAAGYTYYSTYCPSGSVTFTDHSIPAGAPITGWYWIFENGFYSTAANPAYTFSKTDTTYQVMLIITDANGCTDTLVQGVYVNAGFSFSFRAEPVCVGEPSVFQPLNLASGDTLHDVMWNFGEPGSGVYNTSFLYAPTHLYANPGIYIVKFRAYNTNNCVDSVYKEVEVYPGPLANFTFDSVPYCDTLAVFHNLSAGSGVSVDTLIWMFGDGITLTELPPFPPAVTHLYPGFGTYPVTLTAINANGCRNSKTQNILVSCIASAFVEADTLKCMFEPVKFFDNSGPVALINNWQWFFGDGQDTTYSTFNQTIRHVYNAPGEYLITLVIASINGSISITDTSRSLITVRNTPKSAFEALRVCFGDTTKFINLSDSNGVGIIYNAWRFGEGGGGLNDTSSLISPLHRYPRAGKFNVSLVVGNHFGCYDTLKQDVVVNKLPVAGFINSMACSRDHVYFTDKSQSGDTVISYWRWAFGDPAEPRDTSIIQEPFHTYSAAGTYVVYLKVKDKYGCADTTVKMVEVLGSPLSAFTIEENFDGMMGKIRLNNVSENAGIYEWDFGNGTHSAEENPIVTYAQDGTYTIRLVTWASNDCSDTTSFDYEFMFHNLFVPNAFSPTNIIYKVRLFKPVGINLKLYHAQVFDITGHLMWESNVIDSKGRPVEGWDGTFDGNLMPQGTYMWKISASFKDGKTWEGSDIGKGSSSTMGTVTLIR